MTVAPGVDLTNVSVGDVVSVHYTREVTFVVGSPHVPVGQVPVTSTVDQIAQTPGGIGYNAAVVVGRVVKLNGPTSFDVVNANGGGIWQLPCAAPCRPRPARRELRHDRRGVVVLASGLDIP